MSSQTAISCADLLSYQLIDPTGRPIGSILDVHTRQDDRRGYFLVRCFAKPGRHYTCSWLDAVIDDERRRVLINPTQLRRVTGL